MMETQSALCRVRLEFLNISVINSSLILTGKSLHSVAGRKRALQLYSLRVLRYFTVSIIQPLLYTYLSLHATLFGRTSGTRAGTFKKGNPLSDIKTHWPDEYFHSVLEGLIICFVRQFSVE